jgi:hypothetical protein
MQYAILVKKYVKVYFTVFYNLQCIMHMGIQHFPSTHNNSAQEQAVFTHIHSTPQVTTCSKMNLHMYFNQHRISCEIIL